MAGSNEPFDEGKYKRIKEQLKRDFDYIREDTGGPSPEYDRAAREVCEEYLEDNLEESDDDHDTDRGRPADEDGALEDSKPDDDK